MLNREINYEDVLGAHIFDTLTLYYGLIESKSLYPYLYLRCCIHTNPKKLLKKDSLIDFLISELGFCCNKNDFKFIYDGQVVAFKKDNSLYNSLENILDDIKFGYDKLNTKGQTDLISSYREILKLAKTKAKSLPRDIYYSNYIKFYALQSLNEKFGCCMSSLNKIQGLTYDESFYNKLPLEIIYKRYVDAAYFNTSNVGTIREEALEEFIYRNLYLIEEGLKPLKRQKPLGDARIDILARDKDNKDVIIELKTSTDKSLIWQSIYYPAKYKEENPSSNIRFITICNEYPEYILTPLKSLKGIESYKYSIVAFNGRVENLNLEKIL